MASKPTPGRRQNTSNHKHFHSSANLLEGLEPRMLMSGVTFVAPVTTIIVGPTFLGVSTVSGDLNGDGIPDLVVARQNQQAQVYLGTATGTLTPSQFVATGGPALALGDFNGDGKLDVASTNGVFIGSGDGTFAAATAGFTFPANTVKIYAEDVNGDGKLDLVAATFTAASGTGQNAIVGLSVLLGNGNGSFKTPVSTQVGTAPNIGSSFASFAFGDFNASGKTDIVTAFGVMPGNGDGTFGRAITLPYTSKGTATPVLPSSAQFAMGDFNGDGNSDIATLPASRATGQVELFLGNGKGAFTDNGPIAVATNEVITDLAASDLTGNGNTDLIAGITNSTGNASVAVLVNGGGATFAMPALYGISGPSATILAADFNGDGNPDLLSINEPSGTTPGASPVLLAAASVLLSSKQAGLTAAISLRASANPVIAGSPSTYTAQVSPAAGPNGSTPTGSVTFFDGASSIGSAPLIKGKATLTITAAGLGIQQITAVYNGDSTYAAVTSTALAQTVLTTGAKTPLLIPSLGAVTLPSEFLPGDKGSVTITITNGGNANANGRVTVNLYLSATGVIDAGALLVSAPALQNRAIHLTRGHGTNLATKITAGGYAPGSYFLIAQLIPVLTFSADQVSQSPIVTTATFQAAGQVFGTVGNHRGLKLRITDPSGESAVLSINGLGSGTVTQTGGATVVSVTGTSPATQVILNTKAFAFNTISVIGTLNSIMGRGVTLIGGLSVTGGVKMITLSGIGAMGGGTVPISLGGGPLVTLSLGNVGLAALTSASAIKSLTANFWQGGLISAPSINSLVVNGPFAANIDTHAGGKLLSARINTLTGGIWAIAGGIGLLHVTANASNASIYAGADSGSDNVLGTTDDVFATSSIDSVVIGGADSSTIIIAGGSFPSGTLALTSLTLLSKSTIRAIAVHGNITSDSKFLAAKLPAMANLGGVHVKPSTDPHFAV